MHARRLLRGCHPLHGRGYEGCEPLFEVPKVWEIKHFSHREDRKLLSEKAQHAFYCRKQGSHHLDDEWTKGLIKVVECVSNVQKEKICGLEGVRPYEPAEECNDNPVLVFRSCVVELWVELVPQGPSQSDMAKQRQHEHGAH